MYTAIYKLLSLQCERLYLLEVAYEVKIATGKIYTPREVFQAIRLLGWSHKHMSASVLRSGTRKFTGSFLAAANRLSVK